MLDHAVARNEITPAFAVIALDLIYGSLWYRPILRVGPLDHHWADATAAAICHRPVPRDLRRH